MRLWESGPDKGQYKATEYEYRAAKERFLANVQEARLMEADWKSGGDDCFSLVLCGQVGVAAFGEIKRKSGAIQLQPLP
jgi:hypothetical protein